MPPGLRFSGVALDHKLYSLSHKVSDRHPLTLRNRLQRFHLFVCETDIDLILFALRVGDSSLALLHTINNTIIVYSLSSKKCNFRFVKYSMSGSKSFIVNS